MQPFQQRVVDEKRELDDRLSKLQVFLAGGQFNGLDAAEKDRLCRQESLMSAYSNVLRDRIAEFAGAACPECKGSGTVEQEHDFGATETLGCPYCEGTGTIQRPA